MLMVCHHLSPDVPEDLAFAESRIRATTIAAEDVLHDMGALSITSSDAQAMGRIGEVITRTWQVAHVMKARRGPLGAGLPADNERARRYVAKYTINPAIAHGIDARRSARSRPASWPTWCCGTRAFFGVRPSVVIKGGAIAWAALGDPNASIPTPQPVLMRPSFGDAIGAELSVSFVAPAALDDGLAERLGLRRRLRRVRRHPRDRQGADAQQRRAARASTSTRRPSPITVDGELIEPAPAERLPLAQLYSLF